MNTLIDPIVLDAMEERTFYSPLRDSERIPSFKEEGEEHRKFILENVNFEDIRFTLGKPVERGGQGWTKEEIDRRIEDYVRYLALHRAYPKGGLVPSELIDQVWHTHILYTKQYHADCQRLFGQYFHHQPETVRNDKKLQHQMQQHMLQQWMQCFGALPEGEVFNANSCYEGICCGFPMC